MGETVEALVDAGNASAGPPLGPALGPSGVNVKAVLDEINAQTKEMAGMKVPVKGKVADDRVVNSRQSASVRRAPHR